MIRVLLILVPIAAAGLFFALRPAGDIPADPPLTLEWGDLLPEGEEDIIDTMYEDFYQDLDARVAAARDAAPDGADLMAEGGAFDEMPQIGTFNAVEALDGRYVEIPGFIVPLDGTGRDLRSFLLVPYFGACIHTPPPPPNQIVHVNVEGKLSDYDMMDPFWAQGRLMTTRADSVRGNAAYTLALTGLRPYE